jgi:hypothetical protein
MGQTLGFVGHVRVSVVDMGTNMQNSPITTPFGAVLGVVIHTPTVVVTGEICTFVLVCTIVPEHL